MKRVLVLSVAVALMLGAVLDAQAASTAAGRARAKKANQLAAAGKCKAAVPQFDIAYAILKDPALLFNRAECLRKIGEPARALADYRKFLAELPQTPNRRLVEERIAELDPSATPPPPVVVEEKPAPPPPPPPPPPPVVEAPPPEPPRAQVPDVEIPPALKVIERREEPSPGLPAWVWIGAGVIALAAGGVAAWYAFGRPRTDVPSSALGNFKF